MRLRGRHWLVLWSAAFLAMAAAVVLRQQTALGTARALEESRARRAALEARRAALEQELRHVTSREVLAPRVMRRMGLRFSADSEIVILRVPQPDSH